MGRSEMPTPFICVNGNDVHSATGNGSLHKSRKQQAVISNSHSSQVFGKRRKRNDRSSEMCRLLIATVVLLASGVVAQSQTCKNGGTPTGIDWVPCFCTPSFNGKHCESIVLSIHCKIFGQKISDRDVLSTTSNPNISATTSSPSGNSTQCLNGGILIGNLCYCTIPFYGDRCQCTV
jgi:hypothetical protein